MIFYIPVPTVPDQESRLNDLLNGLNEFYGLRQYDVIAVELEGDEHLQPILMDIAEHFRHTNEKLDELVQAENLLPAEPAEIPPSDPKPAGSGTKNGTKPTKSCQECGEPHHRRSKFCSSACYQRDWYRRKSAEESGEWVQDEEVRQPAKTQGPTIIVTDDRKFTSGRITGKKLA